ncbi:MAG: GNAT family N-acetyltransferase [Chloroflexi bacterium]|nr:GNAT family N-acetyltransferase [Chloroflexota bacterium]
MNGARRCGAASSESLHQNSYLYVVELDGQVIAFANFGPKRDDYPQFDCEMYAIYIVQEHHGKGYGRALMMAAMERMAQDGCKAMYVWVMEQNPAIQFYEGLGGVRFDERPIDIAGTVVTEYAYGYSSLGTPRSSAPTSSISPP